MMDVKKIIWLWLLIIPILQVSGTTPDSVQIRSYTASDYKASSFNYTGLETPEGILYFANENGVLEYDGSQWKLIRVDKFSAATAIAMVRGRIYVGGRNEFGYLEPDSLAGLRYTSLRHLLKLQEEEELKDIWQIVGIGDDVYFGSLEMILRYNGHSVESLPVKGGYIFEINHTLFTAAIQKGLARINNNTIDWVNTDFKFDNDAAFQYMQGLQGENLLITADNGIFEVDTVTFRTSKWQGKANALLAKKSLYNVTIWPDSLYACATYLGGLFLVDRHGEIVYTFDKQLGASVSSLREFFKDKRGNLWLTSDNGLHYLQLPDSPAHEAKLATVIRQISIGDQSMPAEAGAQHLAGMSDYTGSVVFHFATPGYHYDELEYSYYLEGYEKGWSAWKTDTRKEYTNLSGGKYTFHVKARYRQQIESEPAALPLSIPTPWFKTRAAFLLAFVLMITLIVYGVHYRTKKLRLLNKRLSTIISKRTSELVAQREQLRATNNELRVRNTELDNFVYRSSHDLVAPLKSLKGLIQIARQEEEAHNREDYFRLMHTSIEKLEDFIKSIMEYSSNTKKDILQVPIDMQEVLDSIVADLKYYEKADKIELIRNIDPAAALCSDPKRLKIILSNLITNSIKYHNYYQEKLYIEVKLAAAAEGVEISISDNGRGIEEAYLDKIFDMFFRATDSAQGSGLGLYIVKDTVEKLGGSIRVQSSFGQGTTFTLFFPKGENQELEVHQHVSLQE